jgi:hypothetical protein
VFTVFDYMSGLAVKLDAPLVQFLEGQVRTSVLNAWGLLYSMHDWQYFHRTGTLVIKAGYSTGTVSLDTDTGIVTLTGGTFPTDAAVRHIRLGYHWYPVYSRIDGTHLQMVPSRMPEADLTDSAYILQQVIYPLPYEVGNTVQVYADNMALCRLDLLSAYQLLEGFGWSGALPEKYALVGDSMNPGRWNMWVPTIQTQDKALSYLYVARRPQNALVRETRGLVTIASGVATFSDPVVSRLWDGNVVLRVNEENTSGMTGEFGDVPGVELLYNREGNEIRVTKRLTSTTCEVSDLTLAVSDREYVASSMVDVAEGAMSVLMQRLCEKEYGTRIVGGHSEQLVSASRVAEAFNTARQADAPLSTELGMLSHRWYNMRLQYLGPAASGAYG